MVAITSQGLLLTIRDLVDFVDCPRIVYWSYLRTGNRYEQDPLSHQTAIQYREKYDPVLTDLLVYNGINEIDLKYNIHLKNKFIQGKIDILGRSLLKKYPIYLKRSKEIKSLQHFIPIYAYAWLVKDTFGFPVEKGFIYYPNRKELEPVPIGKPELAAVEATAESARNVIVCGMMPDILQYNPRRCVGCIYRTFCNEHLR
jgi:CRISPR-associated protein Cas4